MSTNTFVFMLIYTYLHMLKAINNKKNHQNLLRNCSWFLELSRGEGPYFLLHLRIVEDAFWITDKEILNGILK